MPPNVPHDPQRGWGDYELLVLSSLQRLETDLKELNSKIENNSNKHSTDIKDLEKRLSESESSIITLKTKFGIFGAALPSLLLVLIELGRYLLIK